jgi:hypothetical protein
VKWKLKENFRRTAVICQLEKRTEKVNLPQSEREKHKRQRTKHKFSSPSPQLSLRLSNKCFFAGAHFCAD